MEDLSLLRSRSKFLQYNEIALIKNLMLNYIIFTEPDVPNEVVPNRCESYENDCSRLSCPYGIRRVPVDEECQRCECINPCADHECSEGCST